MEYRRIGDNGSRLSVIGFGAWAIGHPGITTTLVGARNPKQVRENLRAIDIELTHDEIQRIEKSLEELDLQL